MKYKMKYLAMMQQGGNNNDNNDGNNITVSMTPGYATKLQELYPTTKYPQPTDAEIKQNYPLTYGELTYDAIAILAKYLTTISPNVVRHIVIDIGSGVGKLPLYTSGYNVVTRAIGIELVQARHNEAMQLLNNMRETYPNETSKVELINGDMLQQDYKALTGSQPALIWVSNLCFDDELTTRLFNKLAAELSPGTIIITSKTVQHPKITKLEDITVPMSWSNGSIVFVHIIIA